jgi:hypothetical protein
MILCFHHNIIQWSLLADQLCQCEVSVRCFSDCFVSLIRCWCDECCVHTLYLYTVLVHRSLDRMGGVVDRVRWSVMSFPSADYVGHSQSLIWIHVACLWSFLRMLFKFSNMFYCAAPQLFLGQFCRFLVALPNVFCLPLFSSFLSLNHICHASFLFLIAIWILSLHQGAFSPYVFPSHYYCHVFMPRQQ